MKEFKMKPDVLRPLGDYFPEFDIGFDDPTSKGYFSAHISVFDHWLDENEAAACDVMCFSQALKANALSKYNDGEERFMKLYESLSNGGVVCHHPGPIRLFEEIDCQLKNIFLDSLRERTLMDVYFLAAHVRVIGRYDRTDTVLIESKGDLKIIENRVKSAGLFLLG